MCKNQEFNFLSIYKKSTFNTRRHTKPQNSLAVKNCEFIACNESSRSSFVSHLYNIFNITCRDSSPTMTMPSCKFIYNNVLRNYCLVKGFRVAPSCFDAPTASSMSSFSVWMGDIEGESGKMIKELQLLYTQCLIVEKEEGNNDNHLSAAMERDHVLFHSSPLTRNCTRELFTPTLTIISHSLVHTSSSWRYRSSSSKAA